MLFPIALEGRLSRPEQVVRHKGNVLFADDEEQIRETADAVLGRAGFDVWVAADGLEALAIAKRLKELSFVVLDLAMPRMDGLEAFDEIRNVYGRVPILLTSGYPEQEVPKRLEGRDFDGYLQKPYQLAQLLDKIDAILESKKQNE